MLKNLILWWHQGKERVFCTYANISGQGEGKVTCTETQVRGTMSQMRTRTSDAHETHMMCWGNTECPISGRMRTQAIVTVVKSLSHVRLFATPWTAARQASLSFITSRSLLNLCPLSWWCHPTISSSVVPSSSCPQSFPASGSFPVSWFFTSGGQRLRASASASVLPMNIQDWFPLGFTGLILLSKRLWRVFSSTTVWKHQFYGAQPSLWSNSHIRTWLLEKHSFH